VNDDLENVENKDKSKLKMIWRTISFLVGIFFTIVVTQTSHKRNRPAPMCGVEP